MKKIDRDYDIKAYLYRLGVILVVHLIKAIIVPQPHIWPWIVLEIFKFAFLGTRWIFPLAGFFPLWGGRYLLLGYACHVMGFLLKVCMCASRWALES
jgi:hypothetical protein